MEVVKSEESKSTLAYRFAESATRDVADAIRFLSNSSGGDEAAKRFAARLKQVIGSLCIRVAEEIITLGKPYDEPNDAASLHFSRPIYRERLETNRNRGRRSSSGLWYVYYTIQDQRGTGTPDTIAIIRIRHSAARPFTLDFDEEDEQSAGS